MTRLAIRNAQLPRLSRFGWLMGLYAENFNLLTNAVSKVLAQK